MTNLISITAVIVFTAGLAYFTNKLNSPVPTTKARKTRKPRRAKRVYNRDSKGRFIKKVKPIQPIKSMRNVPVYNGDEIVNTISLIETEKQKLSFK